MLIFFIKCAETDSVLPAFGVIVSAVALPEWFRIVNMEFILVVLIIQVPTIWLVPVALLTTVYGRGFSFKVTINKK